MSAVLVYCKWTLNQDDDDDDDDPRLLRHTSSNTFHQRERVIFFDICRSLAQNWNVIESSCFIRDFTKITPPLNGGVILRVNPRLPVKGRRRVSLPNHGYKHNLTFTVDKISLYTNRRDAVNIKHSRTERAVSNNSATTVRIVEVFQL